MIRFTENDKTNILIGKIITFIKISFQNECEVYSMCAFPKDFLSQAGF